MLAAPDARTATARVQNGGTVTVVYSHDERRMIFTADGLPPLTGGKVYELWLMAPKSNRPEGLLDVQPGGRAAPVVASGLRPGDQTGLTVSRGRRLGPAHHHADRGRPADRLTAALAG